VFIIIAEKARHHENSDSSDSFFVLLGRNHNGYLVYLSYQLVESVTFAQVMSETFHLATDIKAKKKQLIHMVGDQRLAWPLPR
jgi:hypothetical protein